jgi:glycosyltransferase involved in cell wall biosynthesis
MKELAKCIGELRYDVDVVDAFARGAELIDHYDLVVDIHPKAASFYSDHLAENCIKIAYMTSSHSAHRNSGERKRLDELERRRGVRLLPRRQMEPINDTWLRLADAMFFLGNQRNLSTYGENRPRHVHFIKNTGYDFLTPKYFMHKNPNSFLFIASGGQVHKGLDLLLEAFASRPHLELFVCSSFAEEEDFCSAYHRELHKTSNIHPVGLVDIGDWTFRQIADRCSFAFLPSCSEANAGSVLTAMSAGVIPIVSRECGFEEGEVHYLRESTIDEIGTMADEYAQKSLQWIVEEAARVAVVAKVRYGTEQYSKSVRAALSAVMENHGRL